MKSAISLIEGWTAFPENPFSGSMSVIGMFRHNGVYLGPLLVFNPVNSASCACVGPSR